MSETVQALESALSALKAAMNQVQEIIVGKDDVVSMSFACLLANGHLLIEDAPGVGKTTLARAIAASLGMSFHRTQFTSDMLPADILGVTVYSRDSGRFEFHPGPIFAHLVMADEINRATPKTQSALLEAMAERQVTVEGETRPLPDPFFVIATQNPGDLAGTFPLPESQLDRFLMRINIGYPDPKAEREVLIGGDRQAMVNDSRPELSVAQIRHLRKQVQAVHVADPLLDYLQDLIACSRTGSPFENGLSPRASLALLRVTQALAFLRGRDHAEPEDLQEVLPAVAAHRLRPSADSGLDAEDLVGLMLDKVAIP